MGESSDAESLHSEVALANCGIHERDCGLKGLVISFSRREPRHGEAFVPVQSAMLAHRAVEYWHPDRKPKTHERQRLLIVALAQCHSAVLTGNQMCQGQYSLRLAISASLSAESTTSSKVSTPT